jgi:superoxide dismutase, Cu-Zn family
MSIKKGATVLAVGSLVCIALSGLRSPVVARQEEKKADTKAAPISKAVAILLPTKASKVQGRVTFTQTDGTMHVHADIYGLAPGDHGFHIHEFGVWSEDGLAAGGHYNPTHEMHAGIDTPKRHIGDLGNITANANGKATLDLDDPSLSFYGPTSIIGRGVVVHEKADDFKTQPTGNAGGRVAVGVIGVAKP